MTADRTRPVLVVDSVTHRIGSATVLTDVSLSVDAGQLVVLAGRSGSGKTTLLHLVAGVSRPTSGRVEVLGDDPCARHDWASVSLTPQHSAVAGGLTVGENVGLPASLRGGTVEPGLLASLGLAAVVDRPATDTSLGEQQRTAIARGLVLQPTVALFDEPTSHQDDDHVELVLAALLDARARGSAVVVATHDPRVVDVADRVVRLSEGRANEAPRPS
jgi:ABC-type multidrug transport system ATPase subunit